MRKVTRMKLVPLEDKVVIKPIIEEETTTSSGFVIQRSNDEKPSEGIVEAVGPGITFPNGSKLELDLKPGDKVTYAKHSGTEVEGFIIISYRDIFAVIEESND
jgi:chaperonin GroES